MLFTERCGKLNIFKMELHYCVNVELNLLNLIKCVNIFIVKLKRKI